MRGVLSVEAFGFAVCLYEPFGAHLLACCATINHISTLSVPPLVGKRFILHHNTYPDLPAVYDKCPGSSLDRSIASTLFNITIPHLRKKQSRIFELSKPTMSSSKFVEILDNDATPYSHANVSLEATLDETRRRSASSISSSSDSDKSTSQRPTSPPSPTSSTSPTTQVKTRLRAFSLRKNKA